MKQKQIKELTKHHTESLEIALKKLIKSSEDTLNKIKSKKGKTAYYPINYDVMRYAEDAWRASLSLGALMRLDEKLSKKTK